MHSTTHLTLWVDRLTFERIEFLVRHIEAAGERPSRAAVLRAVLGAGLDALEALALSPASRLAAQIQRAERTLAEERPVTLKEKMERDGRAIAAARRAAGG